jgi:flagellar biosynthesis protein FlhB
MKFADTEKLLSLRSKGKLGLSLESCRLFAVLAAIAFIYSREFSDVFLELLQFQSLDLALTQLQSVVKLILNTTLIAISVYIFAFLTAALLQTKAYFSIQRVFKIKHKFFDFSRVSRVFGFKTIIRFIFASALIAGAVWLWLSFVPDSMTRLIGFGPKQVAVSIQNMFESYLYTFIGFVASVALCLIIIAKVLFRLENGSKEI